MAAACVVPTGDARFDPASADGIMSLQEDVVHCREQAPTMDEIGSPTSDQIFEFCETDIFPAETFQNSDVTCSSNCCCYDQDINSSSYTENISSFPTSNTSPLDKKFSCSRPLHRHPSLLQDIKDQLQQNDHQNQVDQKYSNATTATTTSSSTNTTPNTSSITATAATTAPAPPANTYNNSCCNVSIIFESSEDHEIDNDISASIDFSPSSQFPSTPLVPYLPNPTSSSSSTPITTTRPDYVSLDLIPSVQMLRQQPLTHASAVVSGLTTAQFPAPVHPQLVPHLMMPPPPPVFEEDCLSSIDIPTLLRLNPASTSGNFMDPAASSVSSFMMPISAALNCSLAAAAALSDPVPGGGIYCGSSTSSNTGSILVGQAAGELQPKERLDHYQGDKAGIFCPDHHQLTTTRNVFNSGDIEAFSSNIDGQQLVNGTAATSSAHFTTADLQISTAAGLEDPTFKVGKLSVEQRREKIHRYMKKRNERNFSKKIKYACRKTLADSRPRVRGRFAKNNDDFRGNHHHHNHRHVIINGGNHHHDEDDDYYGHHKVTHRGKEEDVMVDSSELFAQISGVNSFKFHAYPIQSWN